MKKPIPPGEEDPEVMLWRNRIQKSKKYQETNSVNWKRNEKLLFGQMAGSSGSEFTIPFAWGLVKSLETAIYVQDPEGIAVAWDKAYEEAARRWSDIVTYDLSVMDVKSKGNLGLIDCMVYGFFVGAETVTTEKNIRYAGPDDDKKKGKKPEEPEYVVVKGQQYNTNRVHPRDQLFDPRGLLLDLSDHRYTASAFYPTIGSLKSDRLLGKDLPEDIDSFPESSTEQRSSKSDIGGPTMSGPRSDDKDPDFRTIALWEIHDGLNGEIIYLTDHKSRILGRMDTPFRLQIGGRRLYPITLLALNPVTTGFYPKPEIDLISAQLETMNKLDQMIYQDATTKWRKFVTFGNFATEDILAKITDPSPANSIITIASDEVEALAQGHPNAWPDLHNFLVPVQDPAPKQDLFLVRDLLSQEIQEIVGYGPAGRGGMPKTRSAREAMAIKERQDARLNKRGDNITDFYRLFIAKHMQIVQQTMEVERYYKIFPSDRQGIDLLRDGGSVMQKYSKKDIEGQFEYVVFAGTSGPKTVESKRASERELFGLVAPALQAAGFPIFPALLRLAKVYDWRNVDDLTKNYKQAAKEAALLALQMKAGKEIPPNDVLNVIGKLVMACLSVAELSEVAAAAQGQMRGGGGQAPSPKGGEGQRGDPTPDRTSAGVMPQ